MKREFVNDSGANLMSNVPNLDGCELIAWTRVYDMFAVWRNTH